MSLGAAEAIRVLEGALDQAIELVQDVRAKASVPMLPRTLARLDFYAIVTLASVQELAEGVRGERRASRHMNAYRLARHLFEFNVESSWIVLDPERRAEQRGAEDVRLAIENGAFEGRPESEIAVARALVKRVRSSRSKEELGPRGSLIPSRRQMAKQAAPGAAYDRPYGRLSHLAHPGLASGLGTLRLVGPQGRDIWRPAPADHALELGVLGDGAYGTAKCVRRLSPALSVDVEQRSVAILGIVEGVLQSEILG